MTMPRKLGTLVAIPIKGRMLLNRSGGKQSPYVQLRLGADQKKRTKASLIASLEPEWDQEIRLDVYQGCLAMRVSVVDEGKKDELVGEGTLLLHEVLDRGELDGKALLLLLLLLSFLLLHACMHACMHTIDLY
ncbi:hypothetical protein BGZ54_002988 [Gamsiella multidivaricata]|nr:hypothetical protein BGZ54_002988 [Gamsiella multidivaricata]